MSAGTFYFIGDPSQMIVAADEHAPLDDAMEAGIGFEGYKFFDNYNHETLCKILNLSPEVCAECQKQEVGELGFVSLLPRALTSHITRCEPPAIDQLTTRWCEAMKAGGERWTVDQMRPIVEQLRDLILRADREGRRVLHFQFLC